MRYANQIAREAVAILRDIISSRDAMMKPGEHVVEAYKKHEDALDNAAAFLDAVSECTLGSYCADRGCVVLQTTSVSFPDGLYSPMMVPHSDKTLCEDLLELDGNIATDGSWKWDGKGQSPIDDLGHVATGVRAFVDSRLWSDLVKEQEQQA